MKKRLLLFGFKEKIIDVKTYFLIASMVFFLIIPDLYSQSIRPKKVLKPYAYDKLESLIDQPVYPPVQKDKLGKGTEVKNYDGFQDEFKIEPELKGPDPILQSMMSGTRSSSTIDQNFEGTHNVNGYAPPDTDGDVGLSHYMQMVNVSLQIWDKAGNSLYGPVNNSTLWNGFVGPWTGTNNGDAIVLYDEYSDRWLASQFSIPNGSAGPFYELIAISETNDPTGDWHRYAYEFASLPDYPKFGVWNDGYYMTINQFAPPSYAWDGAGVCIFNRDKMMVGDTTAEMIFFDLGTSYGSLLPADADGTAPDSGTPNYLVNLSSSSLRVWEATPNWDTLANSSISLVHNLSTASFSWSGITVNQPGTSQTLDILATRLMNRLQYRNFGTHEVLLTNHTVNADGEGQCGVRWYELRNTGEGWSIYQQGTFAPDDGDNRWMASVAMNDNGDIGLGYSVSSSTTYPAIRYAGQTASNSGTGILDVAETEIFAGSASQSGINRWGDYSKISVDPSDGETFWYTTEYSTGGWAWRTRIASFDLLASSIVMNPTTKDTSSASGSYSVAVAANVDWTVSETCSWVSITNGSGTDDGSFTVTYTENTSTTTPRSCTITVSGEGESETTTLNQAAQVPANTDVQNITVADTEEDCYDATDTITVAGSGTTVDIQSGATATFISGETIFLKPGFHSHSGSNTQAYITETDDYCSSLPPIISNPEEDDLEQEVIASPEVFTDKGTLVNIYPNPTTGAFKLNFLGKPVSGDIILMNFQGTRVLEEKCNNETVKDLNIQHLPSGMYVLIIKTETELITEKIIKNY